MVYIRGVAKPQIQLQNGPKYLQAYIPDYILLWNYTYELT